MPFSISEFNWQLIVIIVGISAAVSYVGDVLGMKIGKRRISLLGLRPRYTSTIVTMFTGIAVAILTLCAAAYTSESVRAAFFGVNYLEREIARLIQDQRERQDQLSQMEFELSMAYGDLRRMEGDLLSASRDLRDVKAELGSARIQVTELEKERARLDGQMELLSREKERMESDVAALRKETDDLRKGLEEMKGGRVIVFQGELLSQIAVESDASPNDIDAALSRLISSAAEAITVKNRESGMPIQAGDLPKVEISEALRKEIYDELGRSSGRKLLRLTAAMNVVLGQVVDSKVDIFDSKIVFRKDEILLTDKIRGGLAQNDASDLLYTMLKQINPKAVALGVLPDPISGTVGNIDSLEFFSVVDRINESRQPLVITFMAANDIYTEGPVNIRIVLEEEEE
ncbi:MAG: DUF3084 domain-containing protein [Synergistaceae bacterium]|nr:DUF3084 domain-containing protein [Synergistaceae bacterium]